MGTPPQIDDGACHDRIARFHCSGTIPVLGASRTNLTVEARCLQQAPIGSGFPRLHECCRCTKRTDHYSMIRFAMLIATAVAVIPSASSAQIQDAIGEIPCHPTDRLLDHVCTSSPLGLVVAAPASPETDRLDPLVELVLNEIFNDPAVMAVETEIQSAQFSAEPLIEGPATPQEITQATATPATRATLVPSD